MALSKAVTLVDLLSLRTTQRRRLERVARYQANKLAVALACQAAMDDSRGRSVSGRNGREEGEQASEDGKTLSSNVKAQDRHG
jgi:hypothetical protein